jgi:methylmalonyl-CoA mutase N-terminal domain/subunit
MQRAVGQSAYERQLRLEKGEDFIVGVNCFQGPHELEVKTERQVPGVYDKNLKATAAARRRDSLIRLRRERDNSAVAGSLTALRTAAAKENENVMPFVIECVRSYATLQEICDVFREIFGEAESVKI